MSNTDRQNDTRIITPKIIKVLTDRPGTVVYRDEIAEVTGLDEGQVSAAIARLKRAGKSEIADDIQVVITAQAWRYVPNQRVQRAARAVAPRSDNDGDASARPTPLTQSIRNYFQANPHRVIYLSELCDAMSVSDTPVESRRVYQGLNNAKLTNEKFKQQLITVVSGQAWQFVPTDGQRVPSAPVASVAPPASVAPASTTSTPDRTSEDALLILEKVADLSNGDRLVLDEDRNLFRLSPMQ